jgi:hypothetical protein
MVAYVDFEKIIDEIKEKVWLVSKYGILPIIMQ